MVVTTRFHPGLRIETLKSTGFDFFKIATLGIFYVYDYGFGLDRNLKVFPDCELLGEEVFALLK